MQELKHLFEPFQVGSMQLKNRVVMPAMHIGMADQDGFLTDGFMGFYEARARAGPGPALMIIGGCFTEKRGMGAPRFVGLDDDKFIPRLEEFTALVHRHDTLCAAQLYHAGRYGVSFIIGEQPVAPSAVPSRFTREVPRELTIDEIQDIEEGFGAAARRVKQSGFDAVELICCSGYLVNQFLSPLTNKRTDRYGGDTVYDRMTFLLESIAAIKGATGADFPLICRLSGADFVEGSHTLEDSQLVAVEMERAGVDLISITGGWHETRIPQITMNVPRGAYVYLAEAIREAVDRVPVVAANRINDPRLAEQILAEDRADLVGMARAFIADPDILRKAYEGRFDDIRTCIACNQGCFDHVFMLEPITCLLNPRVNRERETELQPAPKKKTVLVAGGGPAGMEAAWVAAHRGHDVVLCESSAELGGQALLAGVPPGREEWGEMVRYLRHRVESEGVEVMLETPASPELVEELNPDVVVMATGARQAVPDIEGVDGPNVVYAWEVLRGLADTGDTVVVVGGGAVGIETGTFLAEKGRDVTVLEMLDRCGADIGLSTRWTILQDAVRAGVKLAETCTVSRITPGSVLADKCGEPLEFTADTVVLAVGSVSEADLESDLEAEGLLSKVELRKIGDCVRPRKALEAIHEGFAVGLEL
jgi:2,4-dienoyl-CoA reductase (NADPH2)